MASTVIVGDSSRPIIEWGWAGRALDGRSGDLHVVAPFSHGTLVALIDGLGHGPEAASAAEAAVPILETYAHEPVLSLLRRCHEGLRRTRGAAMSIVSFDARDASVTWTGVGNVDGVLLRADRTVERPDEAILVRGGVVGFQLPPLRQDSFKLSVGDVLILATDGIRSGFANDFDDRASPSQIAESILIRFRKGSDDAHVLVARYLGP
jgi:hypothetical protein